MTSKLTSTPLVKSPYSESTADQSSKSAETQSLGGGNFCFIHETLDNYSQVKHMSDTEKKERTLDDKGKRIARPPNAFMLYLHRSGARDVVRNEYPKATNQEISALVSQKWKKEPENVRSMWFKKADQRKAEHMEKYPEYIFCSDKYKGRVSKVSKKLSKVPNKPSKVREKQTNTNRDASLHNGTSPFCNLSATDSSLKTPTLVQTSEPTVDNITHRPNDIESSPIMYSQPVYPHMMYPQNFSSTEASLFMGQYDSSHLYHISPPIPSGETSLSLGLFGSGIHPLNDGIIHPFSISWPLSQDININGLGHLPPPQAGTIDSLRYYPTSQDEKAIKNRDT